jgi:hypothetical protein
MRPYFENSNKNRTGGVAEVVEYMPSKIQALSSSSSTTKKNYQYYE